MSSNETKDILAGAKIYLENLQELEQKFIEAESQVVNSSKEAENQIESQIKSLITDITERLLKRKEVLLSNVKNIRDDALKPITASKEDIYKKSTNVKKLIDVLNNGKFDFMQYKQEVASIGDLPQVPELKDVNFVNFQQSAKVVQKLKNLCSNYGSICSIAPVQIDIIHPSPGGLEVE